MANEPTDPALKATPANARGASPLRHGDPASSPAAPPTDDAVAPGEADPRDISTILLGAQATTGKALTAAGRMTVNADSVDARRLAQAEQQKREAQQARELANLTAWNSRTTTVGGVQMTNAQAQEARRRFIDNEGLYAERAVQLGYIKADEKEELKRGMRRKLELEDKTGRGTISEAERKELSDWDRSKLGQQADKITADMHRGQGIAATAEGQRQDAASLLKSERGTSVARGDDVFQSAPDIKAEFAAKVAMTAPQPASAPTAPEPLSRKVSASGLEV